MEETYITYSYCPICGRSFSASGTPQKECQYCNDYFGVKVNPLQPVTAKTEQEIDEIDLSNPDYRHDCVQCGNSFWNKTKDDVICESCKSSITIKPIEQETKLRDELTFEECLREEFLLNTQNYPKEYHDLFFNKFNRAEKRYKEQEKPSESSHYRNAWDLPDGVYQVGVDKAVRGSKDYTCRVWMKNGIGGKMVIVATEYLEQKPSEAIAKEEITEQSAEDYIKNEWGDNWLRTEWQVGDVIQALTEFARQKHLPDVHEFSDRLDQIFEQGNPTKAQIIDAFNKFSGERHLPTDAEIDKQFPLTYFTGAVEVDDMSAKHKRVGAKWMKEQIK